MTLTYITGVTHAQDLLVVLNWPSTPCIRKCMHCSYRQQFPGARCTKEPLRLPCYGSASAVRA